MNPTTPDLLDTIAQSTGPVVLTPRQALTLREYLRKQQSRIETLRMEVDHLSRRANLTDAARLQQLELWAKQLDQENAKLVGQVVAEEARANALQATLDRLAVVP